MRHGYEWWEAFWKWLLDSYENMRNDEWGDIGKYAANELRNKYNDFEEKCRKEKLL